MNQYKRPTLTLDQLAKAAPTAEDVEAMRDHNSDASKQPKISYATTENGRMRELSFDAGVAYDPRLINSGVVYGD